MESDCEEVVIGREHLLNPLDCVLAVVASIGPPQVRIFDLAQGAK
ncbi:MAG TPA: hypothetical protein VFI62_06565 [Burkholderiales bacterium]|nr:hypothetical protein [Burkholderiales bacterium]